MRKPVIDTTVSRTDISGDAAELDHLRAHRVVEYIRDRFPAVRYSDAPEDFGDALGGRALDEAGKPQVRSPGR